MKNCGSKEWLAFKAWFLPGRGVMFWSGDRGGRWKPGVVLKAIPGNAHSGQNIRIKVSDKVNIIRAGARCLRIKDMSEQVKPVVDAKRIVAARLTTFTEWPEYDAPGKVALSVVKNDGCSLLFTCPGCGQFGAIQVGFHLKPTDTPSWQLIAGDPKDPTTWTLTPSIWCKGCCSWHGFLVKGVFQLTPP
jgi:hypothetical protein